MSYKNTGRNPAGVCDSNLVKPDLSENLFSLAVHTILPKMQDSIWHIFLILMQVLKGIHNRHAEKSMI